VTVGESLTEARYQAGLSVGELSERTRIRDSVIRSIERDDYEACGGDLYVRGYVRAIAGAVGIDAQPLIQEFDHERGQAADGVDGGPDGAAELDGAGAVSGARPYVPVAAAAAGPSGPAADDPDATSLDLPALPAGASSDGREPDETRFDLPAVYEDPSATRFDLPPVRADHTEDMMAAGYDLPRGAGRRPATGSLSGGWAVPAVDGWSESAPRTESAAASPRRPRPPRDERRRRGVLIGLAAVAVLAIVAVIGVRLSSSSTSTAKNAADSTPARSAGATAKGTSGPTTKASAKPTATPTPTPTKTAAPKPPARPPVTLLPVTAADAFGPAGLADGDNPQGASYAIARNAPLPWSTNWYATAQFGLLKHGTGLLLSLGQQDTITSVVIDLTHYQGVNLQLKVGNGTAPQDFKVAATADNTGGTVRLTFRHAASARYLLIWFTQLPPNGVGQYQESVYHVLVNGRR
jgi:cytoskeletal protein RodZ